MVELIKAKGCNVYLVVVDGKKYVVDTGLPGNERRIAEAVKECEGIILTHSHFDHMGSARALSKILKSKVYAHPKEFEYLKGIKKHEYKGLIGSFARFYESIKKPKYLEEVESVEELKDLEIIHTPGHTEGSISILVGDSLICGDLVRCKVFSDNPTLSSKNFNWNDEEYRRSLRKVLKFEFEKLYPGHGRVIRREEFEDLLKKVF
ncbi:Zn-dependent hydrolase including glyoxylase-like protein [Ferroglobus placidus DSM 10642]|uniref:Zn-dependent hydrolase including glyoxylase-like protein n=1 Tax=Ferroglobus placidus (strain DSM 10642 / AEDII12DO) TaxID=589924 RepID=D3S2V9_FERPA|nr:MBL fold metallo-hydrolase [Ferroglobus placidus]ADC66671.1 Zn-dependent hydrolase including glyoxylase-like protein [Ferroglobus placidus DSM 10642]